ncbi:dual specificity protein phosphatase family protein [Pigmentiphaga litoralis]|uniref:dual specificity protein phosphatase family protein n=1 Tax=Pigmentiphaga litoralis TaxID=516702 RepID=UPI003B43D05D
MHRFFGTYGFATWATAQRAQVGSVVFGWEHLIPLWPWTIVPYWSIDLLYGLSLLLCATKRELDTHGRRLLTAQAIAVTCFLLFPLRFSVDRPAQDGVFGWMFDVLMGFDKPFNQAPSLHITLLVVLWVCYAAHSRGIWKLLVHGWFALIGLSVLTTWQHHFIDLPTGVLAGWLCVWLWPDHRRAPTLKATFTTDAARRRLAWRYLAGAGVFALLACRGGAALWLAWPALSLGLVALNYAWLGPEGFQKRPDGTLSLAARWLFAPYLVAARINAAWWTRRHHHADAVVDGVWLGPLRAWKPSQAPGIHGWVGVSSNGMSFNDMGSNGMGFKDMCSNGRSLNGMSSNDRKLHDISLIDMTAEIGVDPAGCAYATFPVLDLTVPNVSTCLAAADAIEQMRQRGPVLVACALGYSRSATAVAAWLLCSGRAASVDDAVALLQRARPQVVLTARHRAVLSAVHHAVIDTPRLLPETPHAA